MKILEIIILAVLFVNLSRAETNEVDAWIDNVQSYKGEKGETLLKDNKAAKEFADNLLSDALKFEAGKGALDRPEDVALTLYIMTHDQKIPKALRNIIKAKIILHTQHKKLEEMLKEGQKLIKEGNA